MAGAVSGPAPRRSVTHRGFTIYDEVTDSYGHVVRVQHSSSATRDAVWIFCDDGGDDRPAPSPHLDVAQATRVRDALSAFIAEYGGSDGE